MTEEERKSKCSVSEQPPVESRSPSHFVHYPMTGKKDVLMRFGNLSAQTTKEKEMDPSNVNPGHQLTNGDRRAFWDQVLAPGQLTLLVGSVKVGATTLVAHFLKTSAAGGYLCGLKVKPCKVLLVTEETEERWAQLRDEMAMGNNVVGVFPQKQFPLSLSEWHTLRADVIDRAERDRFDVVIFDALGALCGAMDENDARSVGMALMPLRKLPPTVAVMLVHRLLKSDQKDTVSRGSSAAAGLADTVCELRRVGSSDAGNSQRTLMITGRRQPLREIVIALGANGYSVIEQ